MSVVDTITLLGLKGLKIKLRTTSSKVRISKLNVLTQVRKTFEGIDELADSIQQEDLFHPLMVARLDERSVREYLDFVNSLWGTNHKLGELKVVHIGQKRKKYYFVLIAGERRLRAIRSIGRRFDTWPYVKITLYKGINPLRALILQVEENVHTRPPAHEEAGALVSLFNLIRMVEPGYSLAQFSRDVVKRGEEAVRNALRFCELPDEIRRWVENGDIPYGIGVELSRLREAPITDHEGEMLSWAIDAVLHGWTVSECREKIATFLANLADGQGALFEDLSATEIQEQRRRVVGEGYIHLLHGERGHMRTVLGLYESGHLGQPGSEFSSGTAVTQTVGLARLMRALLPRLEESLTANQFKSADEVLGQLEHVLEKVPPSSGDLFPSDN